MQEVKIGIEKRGPILCDRCGTGMVFSKEILKSSKSEHIYLKYICPCRAEESGCGTVKMVRFDKGSRVKFRPIEGNSFNVT